MNLETDLAMRTGWIKEDVADSIADAEKLQGEARNDKDRNAAALILNHLRSMAWLNQEVQAILERK